MTLSDKPLVCLIWDDAHMSLDEWTPQEVEQQFHQPERVKTFGLLIQDNLAGVTLAMEEGESDGKFRHLTFVPRGMVVEMVDLGVPKKKLVRKRKEPNDG